MVSYATREPKASSGEYSLNAASRSVHNGLDTHVCSLQVLRRVYALTTLPTPKSNSLDGVIVTMPMNAPNFPCNIQGLIDIMF